MNKKRNIQQKKGLLVVYMLIFAFCFSTILYLWYHGNKPIFRQNIIEDNFEDQIVGIFPAGWLSGVNPLSIKVVNDDGNNVMEVKSTVSEVVEIVRRFKKTSVGVIECKAKILDANTRFVIHIPQLDREYDPYDDIIIAFLEGGVYVVDEDNLITQEEDPTFWEQLIMLDDDMSWAIDERSLEDSIPIMRYEINSWYSVRIDFNRESFLLTINGDLLGEFNYPKYNPSYFASLYFCTFATSYNFKFYVDNVKIILYQPVDYIHPLNIIVPIIMLFLLSMIVLCYFKFSKLKRKLKKKVK